MIMHVKIPFISKLKKIKSGPQFSLYFMGKEGKRWSYFVEEI